MAQRFLIVGPSWIGDMVLAQSLFRTIKQRHPDSQLDVLAPSWTHPLLARMPEVDEAVVAPFVHGRLDLSARLRLGRELRTRHYDHAMVLPNSLKSALVPFLARARVRTGYTGEFRYGLLNDARRLDRNKLPRTVDRFVALALAPGEKLPEIPSPRLIANADKARDALRRLNRVPPAAPVLGLCPGAEYGPAKRWPAEYFAAVAKSKLAEGWEVWLFGSDKDRPETTIVQTLTQGRCFDLGGQTSLAEAIDLLSLTSAIVTNDSGLMHVAAALERPVVALYGSSDPRHTPPMTPKASVLSLGLSCSPCFERECPLGHLNCLRQLKPERVLAALKG
ncbi:MAG: lipopolysaccharide heptosyltransferase II [Gammaproteobacteria bacterium]|nr:lipopolysaccharide heptosyltransferase II [Gammaproteobacteria bacterium]MDH3370686.1 lipopolysaccharide heptosyltransferase II [Gammaproteobacteria bacterium]MDH3406217.1 lipopolysaccharide heptosyltransferase II [Gammaproteobacteria bacterium]MDH3562532.1 lipopolysaccharide heptosyltransferase II [Gammaproteobacteria bacterium]